MSDRFFNTEGIFENNGSGDRQQTIGPYYYGYTMTVGPDGRPVVKEYGNVRPTISVNSNVLASGANEPFVDEVLDEENRILKIVDEMPGVEKSDIQVSIQDKSVSIKTDKTNRKYETNVPLKYKVDENSTKAQYKNGILELTFKLAEEKAQGKIVSVE